MRKLLLLPALFALPLLFAAALLAGCASEDEQGGGSSTGGIAVRVIWPQETQPAALALPPSVRQAAPAGVFSLVATVSGADMADVSAAEDTTPGESGTFNVDNVPVGANRTLTLQGFSEAGGAGTVLYEGTETGITVEVGVNAVVEVTLEGISDTTPDTTTADVPVNAAVSVSFTDLDPDGGQLFGDVVIAKASDESDVTSYVLYWGSEQNKSPITTFFATGSNLTHTFAWNTAIPSGATHFLVFTANASGEMATGVSVLIVDLAVPVNAAVGVTFTDTDPDGGQVGGDVVITKASDESDVTSYVLYWGSVGSAKESFTAIATLAATGSNLTHTFAADTTVPVGATHLLVFTANADGEMGGVGVYTAIVDLGVPVNAAVGVAFTDTDPDGGQLAGDVVVARASDESDVTSYLLYWGSSATTKQSPTAIAPVTGSNLTHTFPADTAVPVGATHLLVFTANADGEMGTGVNTAIVDLGVPVNAAVSVAFTDTDLDGGQIGGDVGITKATDESDVTSYLLYWGSNPTTKQSATPIATLAATGFNLTHTFAANTAVPGGATHLLVFTANPDGEMATGVGVLIVDLGVPTNAAVSVAFTDLDSDGGQIEGAPTFTTAADESDVTEYRLYWGQDATAKLAGNDAVIDTVLVGGGTTFAAFAADTPRPAGAIHLLVFTANADGEMATGVSVAIVDLGVRYAYVTSWGLSTVSVIDTSTNTVTTTIPVGNSPWGIAITPDGNFA